MSLNNVPTITTGQLTSVVHEAWRMRMPIMLWGEPGIGKSQVINAAAEAIAKIENLPSFGVLDRRLSQYEPVEIRGIPRVVTPRQLYEDLKAYQAIQSHALTNHIDDEQANRTVPAMLDLLRTSKIQDSNIIAARMEALRQEMANPISYAEWSRPDLMPREDKHGKHGIVFLDELPNAPMDVQAPSYQLILDRMLGDHRLPDGWSVVAAGNRSEDRSGVYEMSAALANRFTHFQVAFSFDDWLNWAYQHNIHDMVIAYNRFNNGVNMFMFDPSKDDRAFATPRSWEQVSRIMKMVQNSTIRNAFVGGCVGVPVSTEFSFYCDLQAGLPDINEIIEKWHTPARYQFPEIGKTLTKTVEEWVIPDEEDSDNEFPSTKDKKPVKRTRNIRLDSISISYMVITGLASRVSEKTIGVIWDIIDSLCDSRQDGSRELGVALCLDCIRKNKALVTTYPNGSRARFLEFGRKNSDTVKDV